MSSKHSNVAIIDMGTNTFHLLIAEMSARPRILVREREAVKVGKGGIHQRVITEHGFARAIDTLKKFKTTIDQYEVSKTLAFGTSAIRNASNGKDLIESIRTHTGIDARIIDGDEEADLIYRGVRSALDLGAEHSLILDIGGGSCEFIFGNNHGVQWKKSFDIGGQRLLEQFQRHDPIHPDEVAELENFLKNELSSLTEPLKKFNPTTLVGVSGTFDTLSEMFCHRNNLPYYPEDSETPFDIRAFSSIYKDLLTNDRAGRMALAGMIDMRVDMIVVACVLVNLILSINTFNNIRVSSYSLKEGVLASLL